MASATRAFTSRAGTFANSTCRPGSCGYASDETAALFNDQYRSLLKVVNETLLFGRFCYTQFADTFPKANGLLYADRTPKEPIEEINAATCNLKPGE